MPSLPELEPYPLLLRYRMEPDRPVALTWNEGWKAATADGALAAEILPGAEGADCDLWQSLELRVTNTGTHPCELAATLRYAFRSAVANVPPSWLIPGIFYGDNGYDPKNTRIYPRFHPTEFKPRQFVSPRWSFRADRCAVPAVFARAGDRTAFLATSAQFSHGMPAIGFSYEADETALVLHLPWEEQPSSYALCRDGHLDGFREFVTLAPGESMSLRFFAGVVDDADNYGFAPVLRALYAHHRPQHGSNPWMNTAEAAELAAYGLYHWFYQPKDRVLVETCSFDKYYSQGRELPGYVDRYHMHVSWISGVAYGYALARWGDENGLANYHDAGCSVIDRICTEGVSPCGAFWGQWTKEGETEARNKGWDGGWNPDRMWLHARTLAEACTYLADAIRYEENRGRRRESWREALESCLDFATRVQRDDGCLGTYYHAQSGRVHEWSGTGALAWIPALLKGAELLPDRRAAYESAAMRAGEYYSPFIERGELYGGCEDVSLSPSTEDAYYGILAYGGLYEKTLNREFLLSATRAAERLFTFRWMYNTRFPQHTFLQQYDFRTVGGDVASPPNQHLHNYGLMVHTALIKLSEWTGDPHYRDRALDHLHYALQMIARADGDLNARRGMMGEQWYHTDWWQPKGCLLALAHCWCAGFMILVHFDQQALGDRAV